MRIIQNIANIRKYTWWQFGKYFLLYNVFLYAQSKVDKSGVGLLVVSILTLYATIRLFKGDRFYNHELQFQGARRGNTMLWFLGGFFACFLLFPLINFIIGIDSSYLTREKVLGIWSLYFNWILVFQLGVLVLLEEITFRIVLFDKLRDRTNLFLALLVSTLLFLIVHVAGGSLSMSQRIVQLFLLHILFCMSYVISKKRVSFITGIHLNYNLLAVIFFAEV